MQTKQHDVKAIANYLEAYKEQLSSLYKWDCTCNDQDIFDQNEIEELGQFSKDEIYDKDRSLREIIRKKVETNPQDKDKIYAWIVDKWGRITKGDDGALLKLIDRFMKDDPQFKRIASTSKIGAFLAPEKYVIYDSRIAYSLNWILLKQNKETLFFPVPDGQNTKKKAFDLEVLIRLKNIGSYKIRTINDLNAPENKNFISAKDAPLFIPEKEAYSTLNELIKSVHRVLWKDEPQAYYKTEMLLFAIADTVIYKDITDSVTLQVCS